MVGLKTASDSIFNKSEDLFYLVIHYKENKLHIIIILTEEQRAPTNPHNNKIVNGEMCVNDSCMLVTFSFMSLSLKFQHFLSFQKEHI